MAFEAEREFMQQTLIDLRQNYEATGRKASGNWGKQLESNVESTGNGVKFQVLGERYTGALLNPGRKPNAKQSQDEAKKLYPIVLQWIKDKGLNFDKGVAFAIALKWVYKGINVPNKHNKGDILDNVLNRKWVGEAVHVAGGALLVDFKKRYLDDLKKII